MEQQYECDLEGSTEIVLSGARHTCRANQNSLPPPRNEARGGKGSTGRVAASAVRMANSFGAAFTRRRELGHAEAGVVLMAALVLAAIAVVGWLFPRVLAFPIAFLLSWIAIATGLRWWRMRQGAKAPPVH